MAGRARLSLSNTVLLSLTLLTERVSYRSLSHRFHLEKGNIHRIFFSFCERVNALEEKLIKWPSGRSMLLSSVGPLLLRINPFFFQAQRLQRFSFRSADPGRFRRSSRPSLGSWGSWVTPSSQSVCQPGSLRWTQPVRRRGGRGRRTPTPG